MTFSAVSNAMNLLTINRSDSVNERVLMLFNSSNQTHTLSVTGKNRYFTVQYCHHLVTSSSICIKLTYSLSNIMKNVRRIMLVAILAILLMLHDHVSSYILHHHHVSACQLRSMYSCKAVTLGVHHINRITKMKPLQVLSDAAASVENTELVVVNKSGSVLERIRSSSRIMYKFSRPHTIKVSYCTLASYQVAPDLAHF